MNPTLLILLILAPILVVFIITSVIVKKDKKLKEDRAKSLKNGDLNNETLRTSQKKISRLIGVAVSIPLLATGIMLLFLFKGCSSDSTFAFITLEKNNKKYVYQNRLHRFEEEMKEGKFIHLDIFSKVNIFPLKDGIYIDPINIEGLANIATGKYQLIDYDQGNHDGFVINSDSSTFSSTSEILPSDKIGKSIYEYTISMSDEAKELTIKWRIGEQLEPIQNCELLDVWEVTNPYPGKTVGNYRKKILVNATELLHFFNPNAQLSIEEDNLLVIRF